jgi:fumarate reductase subunit D
MTYKATLGTTSILITIVTSLLLAFFLGFFLYKTIATSETIPSIIYSLMAIVISTLLLVAYLYHPTHYTVDAKELTIGRPVKDVKIPIGEIKDAFIVRKESMAWTERVGGNGGVFGFYGNFRNNFGLMTWYATKLGNYIMIETVNNDRIIITPDNTGMVKEIRRLIGK